MDGMSECWNRTWCVVCGVCVCVVDASEEGGYVVESITSYIYLVRM